MEYGLQLLFFPEEHSYGDARGSAPVSFQLVATVYPDGAALFCDRAGMELDDVSGRRMVFPDGVRDVCAWQTRFPAARAGILSADRGKRRQYPGNTLWRDNNDRDRGVDGPAGLAARG